MRVRRFSARACAAVVIATSLGTAVAVEARENQVIESIDRYCRASWRNARIAPQDWEECTQQTFLELLDRVSRDRWREAIENRQSSQRRELNRSIWRVAQRWRRASRPPGGSAELLAQTPGRVLSNDRSELDDVLRALGSPDSGLSARQQDVVRRWMGGSSVAEIAADLELPAARISDEKYKAIQKLRRVLA